MDPVKMFICLHLYYIQYLGLDILHYFPFLPSLVSQSFLQNKGIATENHGEIHGQKMGKSLNNFITLKQAFSGVHERLTRSYEPLAVRQLILNSHYRSPLDFSDAALFAAQSGYDKITQTVKGLRKAIESAADGEADKEIEQQLAELKEKFEAAMNDDSNTSVALSVVFELVRLTNPLLEKTDVTKTTLNAIDDLFTKLGGDVLGVVKEEYPQDAGGSEEITDNLIKILIEQRNNARRNKDFELADAIRDELEKNGIELKDSPEGTAWKIK